MSNLREAAQQALEALDIACRKYGDVGSADTDWGRWDGAMTAIRAALGQAEPEPVAEFDHGIGADRFKVVRGSYWWHILIGDSPIRRGKFHTQAGAEEMAALLLREFRNGAFVQHNAPPQQAEPVNVAGPAHLAPKPAPGLEFDERGVLGPQQAEPVQEPVAWMCPEDPERETAFNWRPGHCENCGKQRIPLYTAPPQRKPLTDAEIQELSQQHKFDSRMEKFVRVIERAHGIGEEV